MAVKPAGQFKKVVQHLAGILGGRSSPYIIPSRFTYRPAAANVPVLSTGLRPLDKTLGIGGLPCGRITELIGPTTQPLSDGVLCLAAKIGAKTQRQQQPVIIIDMWQNFDPWQAERCGLMAPHLFLTRPDTIFDALTTLENAARTGGLVIMNMGLAPTLLEQADPDLRKTLLGRLRYMARQSPGALLVITMSQDNNPFNPANYPPGFPLADLADIRLWVQNENWTYKGGVATAYKASLTVIKNRLAAVGLGADIRIKLTDFIE